jgi:hypothetical protein
MLSSTFSRMHLLALLAFTVASAVSQQPEQKPQAESPTARLATAKSLTITRARGSGIPFDVISSALEGWGRYSIVDDRDKADLIIEVATSGGDGGMRFAGPSGYRQGATSRDASDAEVTMTVYDARSKRVLWIATETARFSMKQTSRENNLVEAAERLALRFHDRVEPPPKNHE